MERRTLLMCEPHLMAFTHILNHVLAEKRHEDREIIACTDGFSVWYGERYMKLPPSERAFIHTHELMHGILMHPDRFQLMRLTRGKLFPALANYAADAILNEGIISSPTMPDGMFSQPKDFPPVTMKFIHEAMKEAIDKTGEKAPSDYDPKALHGQQLETVYGWLEWAYYAMQAWRQKQQEECERAQQKKEESSKKDESKNNKSDKSAKPDESQSSNQDEKKSEEQNEGEDRASGDNQSDDKTKDETGSDGDKDQSEGGQGEDDGKTDSDGANAEGDNKGESASDAKNGEGGNTPGQKPCTCGTCDKGGSSQGAGDGASGGQGQPAGDSLIERMAAEDAWDIEEQLERMKKMLDDGVSPNELIDKINSRIEDSRMRIEQVIQGLKGQGTGQGSILLELAGDLPRAVVPWNHILRRVTTRGLGTKLNDSYVRYGHSTMTALARGERNVPYSPGTTIFTERPRILVILDVSGSHVSMLPVCFSEIWSIAQMKGAVVDVMTFDHGVQEILEIKNKQDFRTIMQRGIRGGGGTVLQNVWDTAAKMRDPYRMAVVMTDGYLDEGKQPKIPVVWLVTPGGRKEIEWGTVIYLPEVMSKAA